LRPGDGPEGFDSPAPAEVMVKVSGGHAVEGTQPFLEAAVIAVDAVDVEIGSLRSRTAGEWQDVAGICALRAKPTIALPPSQHKWLAGVTTPPSAVVTAARLSLGRTASVLAPVRSW